MFHVHVHVLACDFQATKGVVVELEEEMSVSELAKKMKTNPGEGASQRLLHRYDLPPVSPPPPPPPPTHTLIEYS